MELAYPMTITSLESVKIFEFFRIRVYDVHLCCGRRMHVCILNARLLFMVH